MPKINGMQIAVYIYEKRLKTKIVYVSHHEKYMIESFGYNFIWFLPKNLIDKDLHKVLKKIREVIKMEEIQYEFESEGVILKVNLKDIYYFEICLNKKNHINMVTDKRKYLIRKTLKEIEKQMYKELFVRSHSSYFVHIRHINKIESDKIILDNEEKVDISRRNKKEVKNKYHQYLRSL